jgi:catechol 2,3-dioxygenase-like lactoylglutathione lyase family enzyme
MLASGLVTLMVSDMDRSKVFYRDVLRLREKANYSDWAEYAASDGFTVGLHPAKPDTPFPPRGGMSFGFSVKDMVGARSELEMRGVRFNGPIVQSPPVQLAFFTDPDGYVLYLTSEHRDAQLDLF